MANRCKCPGCGQVFAAPAEAAGRRLKCPKCGSVFRLAEPKGPTADPSPPTPFPASGARGADPRPVAGPQAKPPGQEPGWFVRTADETQHGPMDKAQLDNWAREGRLDDFCQVRRADWDHWKWVEDVYPQFRAAEPEQPEASVSTPPVQQPRQTAPGDSRLRPCPDCGKVISRRALECPSCGCPMPLELPARPPARPTGPARSSRKRGQKILVISVASAALVAVIGGGVYLGVRLWRSLSPAREALQVLTEPIVPEPAPEPPPPPGPARPTAQQIATAKQQAAAAKAREVDQRFARDYAAVQQLDQVKQYAELSKSLSEGRFDPMKRTESEKSPPPQRQPYQSQYNALLQECLAYLDAKLPKDLADLAEIQRLAQEWANGKRSQIEQQLLGGQLTP